MGNLKFNNVYIKNFYTIAGPKEKDSKISNVNLKFDDLYFGKQTFEDAEIKMQVLRLSEDTEASLCPKGKSLISPFDFM